MKKHYSLLILFIATLGSCIKGKDCNNGRGNSFIFDMPFAINPITDTFSVGDTMWIDQEFENPLLNQFDGKPYLLNSDFDFRNRIVIEDLKTNPIMPTQDYHVVLEDGSIDTDRGSIGYEVKYSYSNNTFKMKRGIVWRRSGWFVFSLASRIALGSLRESGQKITNCTTEFMELNFSRTNGGRNSYLTQEASDPSYRNLNEDQMYNWYAFYVKP